MGLVLLAFGIIIVLFVLNMFYIDEIEVDKIGYSYASSGNRITSEEALELAKGKYQSKHYKFENEYSYIVISEKKVSFGFKEITSPFDTNIHEIIAGLLFGLFIGWIIVVGTYGVLRIGHESEYLQKQNEYTILVAQLERVENYDEQNYVVSGDFGSLEDIYTKATAYNNWVIKNRYWSDNPFMWWFYNRYSHKLELIVL